MADAVSILAGHLLDTDDHLEALEALRELTAPAVFRDLARACEVCPVHVCDAAICADDDNPECADERDDNG